MQLGVHGGKSFSNRRGEKRGNGVWEQEMEGRVVAKKERVTVLRLLRTGEDISEALRYFQSDRKGITGPH